MQNKTLPKILVLFLLALPAIVSAQLTPKDAIVQMKKGINMGNTLESPYEGDWGNPPVQEYYFDLCKNQGFNFVRIPVRWDKHLGTASPYKIDETWFKRVEQIIDWGLARGLYIVVNTHHDSWIKDNYDNPINQARFDSLWSQVAVRFKNKSEKLIFEICNEPSGVMTKVQNDDMHQKAINVIRKTNPTRLIIFQGIDWGGSDALINAAIPKNDPYLIGSFHSYDPWPFGLEGTGTFTSIDVNTLTAKFQKVKDWSVKNNIPVFLGEFGGISKCEYNARMRQYKTYIELSETFGFAPCAWDDGGDFRIMYRQTKTWFDDIKDILTHSSVLSPKIQRISIVQDTIVKLDWTNLAADYDSIYIERRTSSSTFKRIASLKGNTITFSEHQLLGDIEYYYRVIAHYSSSQDLYSNPQKILLPFVVVKVRKPFTGQAIAIPGKVEAENFDIGGEGFTYHDSDLKNIPAAYRPNEPIDILDKGNGTFLVTDNNPGEWLEYSINVAEKGLYELTAYTAAFAGGGTFRVKIGTVESEIISAPTTYSWYNTKTVKFTMNLDAGPQIMRLTIVAIPLFNIDYLDINKSTTDVSTQILLPGTHDGFTVFQKQKDLIFKLEMDPQLQGVEVIKIYNILGSVVKTIVKPEANFSTSIQDLHSGVYIAQVIVGHQKFSKKIVIQ